MKENTLSFTATEIRITCRYKVRWLKGQNIYYVDSANGIRNYNFGLFIEKREIQQIINVWKDVRDRLRWETSDGLSFHNDSQH